MKIVLVVALALLPSALTVSLRAPDPHAKIPQIPVAALGGASSHKMTTVGQCGKLVNVRRHVSLLSSTTSETIANPTWGKAFVVKDGFYTISCENDAMYSFAAKQGKNRYQYNSASNSSISLYNEEVPREERVPMTPSVCFDFCRTQPGMGFFGLTHGRDCYCMPFTKRSAGDSSDCDELCEGDTSYVCGGKTKSSIYEMHVCGSKVVRSRMMTALDLAKNLVGNLTALGTSARDNGIEMTKKANAYQVDFGQAGDPVAAGLMQWVKVSAGNLEHAGEAALKLANSMDGSFADAAAFPAKLSDADVVKAGPIVAQLDAFVPQATATVKSVTSILNSMVPKPSAAKTRSLPPLYYPIMYFVDMEQKNATTTPVTTCGGDTVGEPIHAVSFETCSQQCNQRVHDCLGFNYISAKASQVCILMSKFTSVVQYDGCQDPAQPCTQCVVKAAKFMGTSIKPIPIGKCKGCLKEVTRAARCLKLCPYKPPSCTKRDLKFDVNIDCQYNGGSFYPAYYQKTLPDGRFVIRWDDGYNGDLIHPKSEIRVFDLEHPVSKIEVGRPCDAETSVLTLVKPVEWHGAVVSKDNGDGTATVIWDSKGGSDFVKTKTQIRYKHPIPLCD